MRVLQIISGDVWAGAEVQASRLISGLNGLQDIVIYAIVFNDGRLCDSISNIGVPVRVIQEDVQSIVSILHNCIKHVRLLRPDIIHVHGFKENFIGGIAGRLTGVRAIIRTFHGVGMIGRGAKYSVLERVNVSVLSTAVIAVSNDLKRYLTKAGFPNKKIFVIHNGVAPIKEVGRDRIQSLRNTLGIGDNVKVIGAIGRLVAVKDYITLLNGAKIIIEIGEKAKFVIVGDGPLRRELRDYAKAIGMNREVTFLGFRTDVVEFLNLFDIFAMTSLNEGTPMALLEAMRLGKPVVATNVGGIPEVVEHNTSGILIPPRSPVSFAEACLKILNNHKLQQKLGMSAKQAVKDNFSLESCVNKTRTLYEKILRQ